MADTERQNAKLAGAGMPATMASIAPAARHSLNPEAKRPVVAVAGVVDDAVMQTRRWVVIGFGVVVAAGLAVAAVVFGLKGVEVASWVAAVAGVVVAVAAILLAPAAPSPPSSPGAVSSSSSGERSISAGGDISGIASTGDSSTNTQQR